MRVIQEDDLELQQFAERFLQDNPDIAEVLTAEELERMLPELLREAFPSPSLLEAIKKGFQKGWDEAFDEVNRR